MTHLTVSSQRAVLPGVALGAMMEVMNTKLIVVVGGAGNPGRLLLRSLSSQPEVRVAVLSRDPHKPDVAALAGDRVTTRENTARFTAEPANIYAWLPRMCARGKYGGQASATQRHNERYPQNQAETVAQALARGVV
jgi:hypothetical protein